MNKIYDYIVIGAGISGCTFAAELNNRCPDNSILLVEHGRRIGGRATTRQSRKNTILEYDHGLPSIQFSRNVSKEILSLISPLITSKKLKDISNDILMINEFGDMDNAFSNDKTYRGFPFMINFCEEIINQSMKSKNINFLFKTLVKSILRIDNLWEIQVNNRRFIKSKNLILASSLIAHPRCLEILNINVLPLSKAFINGKDEIVESILKKISNQEYIKRRNYIFYISNSQIVKNFNHKYLQISFSQILQNNFNFEKIIFQIQSDASMIIVLHCSFLTNFVDRDPDQIIKSLRRIFLNHPQFIDLFLNARLIDKMDWRASQPINNLVPYELQWSSTNNIGFCGDWFHLNGFRGVESAMNSSIRLASLLSKE